MAKQLLTSLRLIARTNFSLTNYSCELFDLIGTVGKVELAVCKSWNVNDKYSWDNAGDLKKLSIDQTIKRQFFHMVPHVFDDSNLSQEIFGIDTWGTVICSLGHGRKHMLTILPTIWRLVFRKTMKSVRIPDCK